MKNCIHQEITINASPENVYRALVDSKKFTALSGGAVATISSEEGGSFACFDGKISGRNIELVPGNRIVQAWRAGNWSEGVYSIVKFEIQKEGTHSKIIFDQSGFPEEFHSLLDAGWIKMYWEPLQKFLN